MIGRALIVLALASPLFGLAGRAEATTVCLAPSVPITVVGTILDEICIPLPD